MFEVKCMQLDLQKIKHKMKNILLILLFLGILLVSTDLSAQDKIDKLSDKIDKLAEQMATQQIETNKQFAELAKQLAVTATKVDNVEKTMDKRFDDANKRVDILLYVMLGIMGGTFGLIGFVIWDRRAANSSLETKTKDLKLENEVLTKEINLLKERETKSENLLKKLLEKFPDLAGLA